jgi:hypothetical protein
MIGTTVLLVARFMAHATRGVNAMASGIPNYAFAAPGDTPVARDAVPMVAVYNDVEHKGLTFEESYSPDSYPALLVLRDTRELEGSTSLRETKRDPTPRTIGVVLAYVTDEKADPRTAQNACEVLLRGAERSLRLYKGQTNADGYRELNGIHVMDIARWKRIEETAAIGGTRFWGWIEVELQVIDSIA